MAIVLSGTWETSEERKRNEESEESIVAGKRGNARGAKDLCMQKETFQTEEREPN